MPKYCTLLHRCQQCSEYVFLWLSVFQSAETQQWLQPLSVWGSWTGAPLTCRHLEPALSFMVLMLIRCSTQICRNNVIKLKGSEWKASGLKWSPVKPGAQFVKLDKSTCLDLNLWGEDILWTYIKLQKNAEIRTVTESTLYSADESINSTVSVWSDYW